jgi:hypothetical protein
MSKGISFAAVLSLAIFAIGCGGIEEFENPSDSAGKGGLGKSDSFHVGSTWSAGYLKLTGVGSESREASFDSGKYMFHAWTVGGCPVSGFRVRITTGGDFVPSLRIDRMGHDRFALSREGHYSYTGKRGWTTPMKLVDAEARQYEQVILTNSHYAQCPVIDHQGETTSGDWLEGIPLKVTSTEVEEYLQAAREEGEENPQMPVREDATYTIQILPLDLVEIPYSTAVEGNTLRVNLSGEVFVARVALKVDDPSEPPTPSFHLHRAAMHRMRIEADKTAAGDYRYDVGQVTSQVSFEFDSISQGGLLSTVTGGWLGGPKNQIRSLELWGVPAEKLDGEATHDATQD